MDINEIIAAYNAAKADESAAKKKKEKFAALIMAHAGGREFFTTDAYNVMIDTRTRTGIDTEALYKDFPEIKGEYGKTTTYNVITAKEVTSAEVKTA